MGGTILGINMDLARFRSIFMNLHFHLVSFSVGLLILRLVLRASKNTGRYLARHGRKGEAPRMETNLLVTDGYYACMRHPMHSGLLLLPWAMAFLVGSISFIIVLAPLEMFFLVLLVKTVEESQAQKKFGEAYLEYKKQVPMFSFEWVCLKELFAKADDS